jgi:hypothetical protein
MALLTSAALAADSTSTWTSATSGQWSAAARWTPNTFFPNNGNGGFATHDAVINATGSDYTVTLDSSVTIEDLTLNAADATLNHVAGDFTATNGLELLAGTYILSGGNISGTIIKPLGGAMSFGFINTNRLTNNTLLDGDLNLNIEGSRVRLQSGATFSGNANFTGPGNLVLFIEYNATLDNKTINMNATNSFLSIEGNSTLTLGPNLLLRGRGAVGEQFFPRFNNGLVNQGTIRADIAGHILYIGNWFSSSPLTRFTNQNLVEATGGGIVNVKPATAAALTNLSGNTLVGGTWRAAGNGSRLEIDAAPIHTNAAEIILDGAGATLRSRTLAAGTFADIEATLATNAGGGTLRVLGGRNYAATAAGPFVNAGRLELAGGTLSAPMLTNAATGEIFGHGMIQNTIFNSGVVRAAGGTLVVGGAGIDGQSGTIQVDSGATLDLSGASADSDADFVVHNGASLNLGGNDLLVGSDYTNAGFGTGNAFNHRANVSGGGQINASPSVTQTLGGDVTSGATDTASMAFGNVHVGSTKTLNYQINNVGSSGPSLRGAIQTTVGGANLTDARLTGAGVAAANFGPVAAGSNGGNLGVTFNATSAGPLTGQRIRIVNNFDNVNEQMLEFSGTAYRLANPDTSPSDQVAFGIVHVGDVLQQSLSITNNLPNDGFSERLNASIGNATGAATTNDGAFAELLPGATDNTNLVVGIDTTTAGTKSGTAAITFTSSGTGTSGLPDTPLANQVLNLVAQVNNFAATNITKIAGDGTLSMNAANEFTLDLGWTAYGDTDLEAELGVANTAAAPADSLAGNFAPATPDFSLNGFGPFSDVAPSATHGGLVIALDSSVVGAFTGLITVQPQSTNPRPFSMNLTPVTIHLVGEVRLAGDYNGDGTVDSADYVVWRDNLGSSNSLINETASIGAVDFQDYDVWRANFGTTALSRADDPPLEAAALSTAVPEPSGLRLAFVVAALTTCYRRPILPMICGCT